MAIDAKQLVAAWHKAHRKWEQGGYLKVERDEVTERYRRDDEVIYLRGLRAAGLSGHMMFVAECGLLGRWHEQNHRKYRRQRDLIAAAVVHLESKIREDEVPPEYQWALLTFMDRITGIR